MKKKAKVWILTFILMMVLSVTTFAATCGVKGCYKSTVYGGSYVANSTNTVIGDSWSAGRMYDWIRKEADAKVMLVTEHGVLCRICKKAVRRNR